MDVLASQVQSEQHAELVAERRRMATRALVLFCSLMSSSAALPNTSAIRTKCQGAPKLGDGLQRKRPPGVGGSNHWWRFKSVHQSNAVDGVRQARTCVRSAALYFLTVSITSTPF
jgi:hypothetical protein